VIIKCENCRKVLGDIGPNDAKLEITCCKCEHENNIYITTSMDDINFSTDKRVIYVNGQKPS